MELKGPCCLAGNVRLGIVDRWARGEGRGGLGGARFGFDPVGTALLPGFSKPSLPARKSEGKEHDEGGKWAKGRDHLHKRILLPKKSEAGKKSSNSPQKVSATGLPEVSQVVGGNGWEKQRIAVPQQG